MAPLLIYSEGVSAYAREALKAAYHSSSAQRQQMLESAAKILHLETGLDCADVLELVGLSTGTCGG